MYNLFKQIYLFFKTFPDRFYPFSVEIEGRLVRGREAYAKAVDDAWQAYGPHHFGYKLTVYRGAFHLMGAIIFVVATAVLTHRFLDSETALYVLVGAAILALFAQEFYFHPKYYGQTTIKGVTDWLTWVIPMVLYVVFYS